MLMQLGTNLHNDYADFVKGADDERRVGQPRATQRGWLTPAQTARAASAVLTCGLGLGTGLVCQTWQAAGRQRNDDMTTTIGHMIVMTFIVLTSVFNAFAYTGGPWPLGHLRFSIGYSGLGDLFVFLYFGLVATLTLPFLHIATTTTITATTLETLTSLLPCAIQVAVLATNIIVVNNLRDRHTDVAAHKRTLAVRFGAAFCRGEYLVNVLVAYGIQLGTAALSLHPNASWQIAAVRLCPILLTCPMAMKEWKAVCTKEGSALNPHVGGAAKVQLFFCILLAIAIRSS